MQYQNKDINVIPIIEENVPEFIYADQFRLEHVFANLLSNAIKFSDPHSAIEVRASYNTRMAGYVTFSVKDEGVGMSAEDQKQLFQPFKQIRPGELQKGRGSGLGLSICKMIVTLHEGSIGCESKKREVVGDVKSGGSEFFFNIKHDVEKVEEVLAAKCSPPSNESVESSLVSRQSPMPQQEPKAVTWEIVDEKDLRGSTVASSEEFRSVGHSSQSSISSISEAVFVEESEVSDESTRFHSIEHYKMLIVDGKISIMQLLFICLMLVKLSIDVLSNRKMLQMVMKRRGFECDQACNGREAVDMVQRKGIHFYQMIFMDAMMPVMVISLAYR
jgi:CheY-like chemotaxis protein